MLFEIFIAVFLGILAGIFTGLIPGVHVNLISAVVVGLTASALNIHLLVVAVFIVSLALTHSFLNSIPSVFLGAPDESQVVAVLPAHQLFLEGLGHRAVVYTLIGSLGALICTILFMPIGFKILPFAQLLVEPYIGKFLLLVVIALLIMSKKFFLNAIFFLTAGLLGFLCFQLPSQQQILLPLLSGLFGTSTLIISLLGKEKVVKQFCEKNIPLEISWIKQTISRATTVGILASFLPGFGSSQGALIASATMNKTQQTPAHYLLLVGGINTVNFAFSLITVAVLSKARNGAIVGIQQLMGVVSTNSLLVFISVLAIVGGLASILGIYLSKLFAIIINKISYKKLVYAVIFSLVLIVAVMSKGQGILILITANCLGILASHYGAQKNMLLGCLLLPVIFYLW
jgi:putative membrane protein